MANQDLNILCLLKTKLDRTTLERLYNAFVRSNLEYASIVWNNCPQFVADLLENVHYRAAKIVAGARHGL